MKWKSPSCFPPLFRTVLCSLGLCIFLSWFRRNYFLLEKAILWVKDVVMVYLVLTNMLRCTSQDMNWLWITCGLLWCFNQLFGLSFWRHPFTADDPLVSKWCNATFLQICSDEESNSSASWTAWGCGNFLHIFIFECTVSLWIGQDSLFVQHIAFWQCENYIHL